MTDGAEAVNVTVEQTFGLTNSFGIICIIYVLALGDVADITIRISYQSISVIID